MTIIKPKNTTTLETKKTSSNILKIFFVTFQIIFGYDFGFIKYRSTRHKIIIKLIIATLHFVSGIAYTLLISPDLHLFYVIWYFVFIVESYSYILTLLLASEQHTFQKFLEHLLWIDSELKVDNSSNYCELKILLGCIISLVWKAWSGIRNVQLLSNLFAQILYFFIFLPLEIPFVILFFVFRATSIRLVALKKILDDEPKKAQILYKSLIESVGSVKKSFNSIFIVTLFANIPSMMTLSYEIVRDLKTMGFNNLINYTWNCIAAFTFLLTLFAPALAAETLSTEVEQIKITLQDSLIQENDEIRIQDIKRFISYIEARPFKLYVLRIIPLDASFVVMSLNFSITYLIVILQLTHIY
ncbi:unnamed protein product [Euphydryas editha]|uniref:Gustatory receptor n=1 Tax=Euphydryas editha TaxID=104508 RepID=A0AAU9UCA2_EUPED|nr:unnamed protein product [Euphydryas editha]